MTKEQWKNLWHTFRWMRWLRGEQDALAWIASYRPEDAALIRRLTNV